MNQIASQNRDVFEYTRSLLHEKEECLRAVKLQYEQNQISAGDYLSCQRSLLQAISQLQELMRKCDSNHADSPGENFETQPLGCP